jgi:aspartate-semialdehyde dehydrogenase
MSRGFSVAVLGATGLVGREMVRTLEARAFPIRELTLLASERSAGQRMSFRGEDLTVEKATPQSFERVELALFSAGAAVSRELAPEASRRGAVVIDNSSAWRLDEDVPLVVPEVNPDDLRGHDGIIANPNCSTIQLVVAIHPLHRRARLSRMIVDTYQSVSGAGQKGLDQYAREQSGQSAGEAPKLGAAVLDNAIPHIDVFDADGHSREERKVEAESRKILHLPDLPVSCTAVRVPVAVSHSEAVHAEFERPISPQEAREVLMTAPGVRVVDEPAAGRYPLARDAAGGDLVLVGRIRRDLSFGERGIAMWVVADNVRKGAALNAVQIAEQLTAMGAR